MLVLPAPFTLRPMTLADETAVLTIDAHCFPTPWTRNSFNYELTTNELAFYQTLTHNHKPIGFAGYWLIADEQHISTIAIDPPWRGRNLGECLFLNMLLLAYTHPAALTTLEVRHLNLPAQALYRKYQFQEVGRRPTYYRDTGEDALLMTLADLNAAYNDFLQIQARHLNDTLSLK